MGHTFHHTSLPLQEQKAIFQPITQTNPSFFHGEIPPPTNLASLVTRFLIKCSNFANQNADLAKNRTLITQEI